MYAAFGLGQILKNGFEGLYPSFKFLIFSSLACSIVKGLPGVVMVHQSDRRSVRLTSIVSHRGVQDDTRAGPRLLLVAPRFPRCGSGHSLCLLLLCG